MSYINLKKKCYATLFSAIKNYPYVNVIKQFSFVFWHNLNKRVQKLWEMSEFNINYPSVSKLLYLR